MTPPFQHEGYPFPPPNQYGFPVHGGYGGVFQPYPYPASPSRKRSRVPANVGLYEYNYQPSLFTKAIVLLPLYNVEDKDDTLEEDNGPTIMQ